MSFKAFLEQDSHIKNLLDGKNFILFFQHGDDVYGSPEEHRLALAKMLTPDDDLVTHFSAFNLIKSLMGQDKECSFCKKDLPKIKIIDRESAEKKLRKVKPNEGIKKVK